MRFDKTYHITKIEILMNVCCYSYINDNFQVSQFRCFSPLPLPAPLPLSIFDIIYRMQSNLILNYSFHQITIYNGGDVSHSTGSFSVTQREMTITMGYQGDRVYFYKYAKPDFEDEYTYFYFNEIKAYGFAGIVLNSRCLISSCKLNEKKYKFNNTAR